MARPRKKPYKSKWEDSTLLMESEVQSIELQNAEVGDKLKNVFYCKSRVKSEGRMCIYYGRINFEVGDKVIMKGRMAEEVFIVWTLNYMKGVK